MHQPPISWARLLCCHHAHILYMSTRPCGDLTLLSTAAMQVTLFFLQVEKLWLPPAGSQKERLTCHEYSASWTAWYCSNIAPFTTVLSSYLAGVRDLALDATMCTCVMCQGYSTLPCARSLNGLVCSRRDNPLCSFNLLVIACLKFGFVGR